MEEDVDEMVSPCVLVVSVLLIACGSGDATERFARRPSTDDCLVVGRSAAVDLDNAPECVRQLYERAYETDLELNRRLGSLVMTLDSSRADSPRLLSLMPPIDGDLDFARRDELARLGVAVGVGRFETYSATMPESVSVCVANLEWVRSLGGNSCVNNERR